MNKNTQLKDLTIGIKGAGEMGSSVAWRLYMANLRKIFMMDVDGPLAVRRKVSFCEAIIDGTQSVENVCAVAAKSAADIAGIWKDGKIAVIVDDQWQAINVIQPDVVVDAILAKRNLGTSKREARLVIGLGPGFSAGEDVHLVVETNRGHHLGRIISSGSAEANTGVPGAIGGYSEARVLRAPHDGIFMTNHSIGDALKKGQVVGLVDQEAVRANIDGVLRGIIRSHFRVSRGLKLGDIDPRGDRGFCFTISDKARAIGGSVLEAVLRAYNV